MANVRVTDLPTASLPLAGDEIVMVDQGGFSRQTTVGEIAPSAAAEYLVLAASGVLAQERVFTPGTGLSAVDGGAGNPYTLNVDSSFFAGFANPSAQVGLVAVNGVAVTAMRSDAAPPLDQGIAPTWTGQHQWSLALRAPNGLVGAPAYTFTADPNTGLYSVGADSLGVATNGVLRLTVDTAALTATLPYLAPAGAVATPSLSFSGDPNTGLYSVGADSLGVATNGVLRLTVDTAAVTATLPYLAPAGAVGAPSHSFSGDTNTGLYSVGADSLGVATNGVLRLTVDTAALTATLPYLAPAGAAATPSLSFSGDTNTGFYSAGADSVGLALNGAAAVTWATTGITYTVPFLGPNGTAGAPTYSFSGDPNTGIYSVGADDIGISAGGTLRLDVSTTAVTSTLPLFAPAGLVGTPSISFSGDTNTGLYSVGADQIGVATNGTLRVTVSTTGLTSTLPVLAPDGTSANPSYSFASDTDTGFYRPASNQIRMVLGTTVVFDAVSTVFSLGSAVQFQAADGTALAPSISFASDGDTGMYHVAANVIGLACGGSLVWNFGSFGARGPDGTVLLPSFTFDADTDTGLYRIGANDLGISVGGAQMIEVGPGFVVLGGGYAAADRLVLANSTPRGAANPYYYFNQGASELYIYSYNSVSTATVGLHLGFNQVRIEDGVVGAPAYSFTSDTDTGIYRAGANDIRIAAGGLANFQVSTTAVSSLVPVLASDGAIGSPSHSFFNDSDSGMYRIGTNTVGIAAGGSAGLGVDTTSIFARDGAAATPSYTFFNDVDTGMYLPLSNTLNLVTGATVGFQITSTQQCRMPNAGTTASAANAFMNSGASNEFARSTSSIRYKKDIEDLDPKKIDVLMKLRPVTYRSKCENDDPDIRWFGFIAEEVAEIEPRLVQWMKREDGSQIPDGMQYERLTVLLTAYVKRLEERVKLLEKKVH